MLCRKRGLNEQEKSCIVRKVKNGLLKGGKEMGTKGRKNRKKSKQQKERNKRGKQEKSVVPLSDTK